MFKFIFFWNKGVYLVGCLIVEVWIKLFVILLFYWEDGIFVDVFLLESNEISFVFSYNWIYFLVDMDIVSEFVDFLCIIFFMKSFGELYNFIGFEKYGKIVLYCDFLCYMY